MATESGVQTDVDAGPHAGGLKRGRPPGSVVVTDEDLRAIVEAHPDWGIGRIAKAAGLSESWTRQRLRGMGLRPGVGEKAESSEETEDRAPAKEPREEPEPDPLLDRFRLLLHDELDPLVQALRLDKPGADGSDPGPARSRAAGWGGWLVAAGVMMGLVGVVWALTRRTAPAAPAAPSLPPLMSQRSRFPRAG